MDGCEKYIKPFADFYSNHPRYISNKEIQEYFEQFGLTADAEAVTCFIEYYRKIGASRRILQKYARTLENNKEEQRDIPSGFSEYLSSLKVKRYSPRTISAYKSALLQVQKWCRKQLSQGIDALDAQSALRYFLYLNEERRSSYSTVRMHRFAVEYYFQNVLRRHIDLSFMKNMRKHTHLPSVLSKNEIETIIKKVPNVKHRMMISLLYSAGLRVSEVINLKVEDVSLQDLTIMVRRGKGNKDRMTVFSHRLQEGLQEFLEHKTPRDYIFTHRSDDTRKLTVRTVQKVFKRAVRQSGITKDASCHDLRHSFATHLLEQGTDIRYIQRLLGHKNISTTAVYTKITDPSIKGVKSPF
jgi:integrase/recombinase XerD